jgi:hypothetical protein
MFCGLWGFWGVCGLCGVCGWGFYDVYRGVGETGILRIFPVECVCGCFSYVTVFGCMDEFFVKGFSCEVFTFEDLS